MIRAVIDDLNREWTGMATKKFLNSTVSGSGGDSHSFEEPSALAAIEKTIRQRFEKSERDGVNRLGGWVGRADATQASGLAGK